MFVAVTPILTLLVAAVYVRADPNPNNPGPGDVFIQGQSCPVGWDVDPTGLWKTMNIELMTGSNFDMFTLTTVATVDGTNPSKTTFSYPCPQVSPHSAIYFYQFTSTSSTNKTWTGRFTITDSAQDIVPPSQSTQPNGENIPWGTGSLVNASSASLSASATSSASGTPANASSSSPPRSTFLSSSAPASNTPTSNVSVSHAASATPTSISVTGTNGAVAMLSVPSVLFRTALGLGFAATGFAAMF